MKVVVNSSLAIHWNLTRMHSTHILLKSATIRCNYN